MAKYLDFFNSFSPHPDTGQLLMKTEDRVISQSIRNLILTNLGERPFENDIGGNIRALLFEPFDNYTDILITNYVKQILLQEPRALINHVVVKSDEITNSVVIHIEYIFSTSAAPVRLAITLSRVR